MKETVLFRDLGVLDYKAAWDYQEALMQEALLLKKATTAGSVPATKHHLLFVEHPPVYTLGKSGHLENVLIGDEERAAKGIQFFHTNRGGDITFHGPGQLVGYPILDLEKFKTDLGWYLRSLEEVVIQTMADYGLKGT